ncbi:MAG: potassium-transporting ATPase subunit KdpC, partial [Planctomycetaceae bacterium]|nr:potassium-transporting ATPase subunit KdpC [Planctomycetaceae bacterium]
CLTLLTGGLYPLVVTGIAQVLFPRQANGSLITEGDRNIGSELIGQQFTSPKYFWGRLSATSPVPYNASASSGSNFGPQHPGLRESASKRIAELTADGTPARNIPVDLVTSSGSGLDPHISPYSAEFQVPRVARERRLTDDQVRKLVAELTEGRGLGLLGEPRVNVLRLNLALDRLQNQGK